MPAMTDISIVIIGKNAEWSIARLIESVIAHVPSHYANEIIYVDSASTDCTLQVVSQYPVRSVELAPNQQLCASAGRFVGSQYATGRYITFLDSDMELLDGWLERAVRLLERHREIAVVSGIQVDAEAGVKVQATDDSWHGGDRFIDISFAGSAAIFRREALENAGTWNPYIVSDEEPELCLRIRRAGYRIVQLQCPSVRHYGYSPPTITALLSRRRRRLFLGYGQVIRYHLRTGLLPAYLRERGWVVMPALVVLAGMIALLVTVLSGNLYWAAGYLFVVLLAIAADALRSRSVYSAMFHALHRALILEGTIRGFVRRPYPPNEYQHGARRESSSGDPICAA
jgi:glycosyltransferase involved in cell wall biosynthesis